MLEVQYRASRSSSPNPDESAGPHERVVCACVDDNALARLRAVVGVICDGELSLPPGPSDKVLQREDCQQVGGGLPGRSREEKRNNRAGVKR